VTPGRHVRGALALCLGEQQRRLTGAGKGEYQPLEATPRTQDLTDPADGFFRDDRD